ncbi:TaqI-like C-terminal specificity domain-containing protein [Elizabethkingia sp. JS20170427COW]|uniref:TaqI-like C-terminal specificity domain-containing protein n=1 Tax=Elizabethkingia sp. JS20170427COW TaxID=2583851 RepID=UPI002102D695|nr:TaqI-like C-terminal specificity domain-containing protein [Elizabethkingia sp. JS20170427COW]
MTEFTNSESWVVLSPIEKQIKDKIERIGTPLKDWDIRINYGIKTGFNDAFIIDGAKRKELIDEDPKSEEIIRPLLRGRDIKRYSYEFADIYLLFIPWHFPLHNDPTIKGASLKAEQEFGIQYPAVYKHLLKYKTKLSNRNKTETGIRYEWYALQRWGANYWEDFSKQKIAWNRIASEKLFSLVDEGIIIQDSMHFFTGNHLKFLCAILNSKLFSWFMYLIIGDTAGGNAGNSDNIRNLTIPKPNRELEIQIERLIKSEQYREIDKVVYKLYDISEQEIAFIDAQ